MCSWNPQLLGSAQQADLGYEGSSDLLRSGSGYQNLTCSLLKCLWGRDPTSLQVFGVISAHQADLSLSDAWLGFQGLLHHQHCPGPREVLRANP